MKTIVMTCKSMTEDVERYETKGTITPDKRSKLQVLKGPFSNELAHLVSAAKAHVNSMGISPVALLDVAASNLTNAVVDLVKLVGMSPSSTSSLDDPYARSSVSPQSPSRALYTQDSSSSISMDRSDNKLAKPLSSSQLAVSKKEHLRFKKGRELILWRPI
jgi:hypothetical protein